MAADICVYDEALRTHSLTKSPKSCHRIDRRLVPLLALQAAHL
jgi:hypothetical protein